MKWSRPVFLFALILTIGCAAPFRAYEGPAHPRSQIAVVRLDPTASRLSFGAIDHMQIGRFVREARVLPGTHSIHVLGFNDEGPFGVHVLPPQEADISVTVSAGHIYIVKASWTNVGSARMGPWVEDKATKKVVAGTKSYGGGH